MKNNKKRNICKKEVSILAANELIPFEQIEPFKRLAVLLDKKVNEEIKKIKQEQEKVRKEQIRQFAIRIEEWIDSEKYKLNLEKGGMAYEWQRGRWSVLCDFLAKEFDKKLIKELDKEIKKEHRA